MAAYEGSCWSGALDEGRTQGRAGGDPSCLKHERETLSRVAFSTALPVVLAGAPFSLVALTSRVGSL